MFGDMAHKLLLTVINTLIDGTLLGVLLTVWSLEDSFILTKIICTVIVTGLAVIRWVYFIKEKREEKRNGKNIKNTEQRSSS